MSTNQTRLRKGHKTEPTQTNTPKEPTLKMAPDSSPKGFWRKLITRSFFGIVMMMMFALMMYVGHIALIAFVLFGQILGWKEIIYIRYVAEKEKNLWGFRSLQWYMLFVTCFYLYLLPMCYFLNELIPVVVFNMIVKYHKATSFALYVIGFVAFILSLRKERIKYQFGQVTWTMMTNFLFVGQAYFAVQNVLQGLIWIILPHSMIICNDIMAYFCGVAFGRKFFKEGLSSLSPNKTWEGAIGATLFTVLFGFFAAPFLSEYDWLICPRPTYGSLALGCTPEYMFLPFEYELPTLLSGIYGSSTVVLLPIQVHAIWFALFASIIGPFGGLLASGMKRAYGKKDFDDLIPGHGGIIDRFDCQYLMVTFVYVYLSTFIGSPALKPQQLIAQFSMLTPTDKKRVFAEITKIINT
eukprot:TRINITY_DN1001_c0_g2_i1.p1 TRINITY_DN1001_c0_g2~~TRINITY_DN1001_c0_g2_i1.p1  ORF type:complete len:410 (+),score=62.78 TRINITY_DN1001_c0_g2_i1:252-1481(+)